MKRIYKLIFVLFAVSANAQWTTDYSTNTIVSPVRSDVSQSITTTDGKTYVVYWQLKPEPVYYQPYVQLIDKSGNKVFGEQGILLNATAQSSSYTSIYHINIDKDNNLYVGITATGEDSKGYIHKVTPSGELAWGTSGISLGNGKGYDIKFFPTDHSGIYLTYADGSKGYINRIDAATGAAIWTEPIAVNGPNTNYPYTSIGEGAVLSDDSFVSLIHARQNSDIFSYFFAQRYSASGTPMWNSLVRLSNRQTMYNTRYSTILDNDVLYLGYYGASSSRFDSYLQRLNPDGTIPWGVNGSELSTDNIYYEMNTSIAKAPGSNEIWSSSRFTTTSQGSSGQYVQKFNKETGARLLGNSAKELFSVDSNEKAEDGPIKIIGNNPAFLIRNAQNNGLQPTPLSLVMLKEDGNFLFPEKYKDIASTNTAKNRVNFTSDGSQLFAVWEESRTGEDDGNRTYIQNFDPQSYLAVGTAEKATSISVYPNPVANIINISSDKKISSAELYDLTGKLVKTSSETSMNVQTLTRGNYVLRVKLADGSVINQKIIKK